MSSPSSSRVFYGWKVVGAGSVINALQAGLIQQAFGSYAVVLEQEFGWSKTVFSAAYSFNRVESGLLGPIHGWALTRFGSRGVMRVGIVVLALGFVAFSRIQTPAQFMAAFFVMAVGSSFSGFLTITTEAVRWFERHRSKALSLTSVGFAVGGLFIPAVVWALQTFGWRTTALGSAVIVVVVALPFSSVFGHSPASRQEDVDGIDPADRPSSRPRAEGVSDIHFTAREALHTRAFWMLSFGHASALLVVGSMIAHLSLYLTTEQGFTLQGAGLVFVGLTVFQLVGQLVGGLLGDRTSKRLLCAGAMVGHMAGLLLLTLATSAVLVWVFVVLHGLAWGIRGPLVNGLRADYFGSTAFGQILGFSSVVLMVGVVGGPLLAGVLADVTGSYRIGFTVLAFLAGAGLLFFALASPPPPPVRTTSDLDSTCAR